VIVIGAPHSSNSVRMVEVAMEHGTPAHLVEGPDGIRREWLEGVADLGLSSSASAPEHLVAESVARLRGWVPGLTVHELGHSESMTFKLPSALARLRDERREALP
jgi:4-hydroxy-3-methylbut-2-enyl diphosphate reductase